MVSIVGSGKTLAYLLPVIHKLKTEEVEKGITSLPGSPHACIVVPSRELAVQVLVRTKNGIFPNLMNKYKMSMLY